MDEGVSFGYWVRRRRKALDLTQEALAQRVGCSVMTIRKIEGDERRPSRQVAERLADSLQVAHAERERFVNAARAARYAEALPASVELPAPLEASSAHDPAAAASATRASAPQPWSALRHNLPAQMTPLIGRARLVAEVVELLVRPDVRLVTLSGPGGIGKTRLALQAAAELLPAIGDGVWLVDLAPISDPALVMSAIAQALGVREQRGVPPDETLCSALQEQRLLLLLDNFEQVIAAGPALVRLLAAVPGIKALVTSREALRLSGEHVVVVAPLPVSDPAAVLSAEQLAQYAAVQLFVARAQAAAEHFRLTDANAPTVAAICVRLDGLPLAIELAAAWLPLFTPTALLARLERRLPLLTRGPRNVVARQQTLRNTIDWSYDLLTQDEQALLRRLGVFVGGCTLKAAEEVCRDASTKHTDAKSVSRDLLVPATIFDGLVALVDKSLLRQLAGTDDEPRFMMLETIREYALEQLEARGETEHLRRQHAHYYIRLGEFEFKDSQVTPNEAWSRRMKPEYENLRSALAWSQTTAGDSETALRLIYVLESLRYHHGFRYEAVAELKRALAHPLGIGRTVAHTNARRLLAELLYMTGNYAAALPEFEQALALAQEQRDTKKVGWILAQLGVLERERGHAQPAWTWLSAALALLRELGDVPGVAWTLTTLAEVAILNEDPTQAEALIAEGRTSWQGDGSNDYRAWLGWTLNHLGHAAQLHGKHDRATELHHESLVLFRSLDDQHYGLPWAYQSLGETALSQGRPDEAATWLMQGLSLSTSLNNQSSIAWCLAGLGSAASLNYQFERAARLWGAAERLCQTIGCRSAPAARTTYERALLATRTQLNEATFAAAWSIGHGQTREQAIIEALALS